MRRVKQRQIRAEMPSVPRNEIRRIRRGRELSQQRGQLHGKSRKRVPMKRTNTPMTRRDRLAQPAKDLAKRIFG